MAEKEGSESEYSDGLHEEVWSRNTSMGSTYKNFHSQSLGKRNPIISMSSEARRKTNDWRKWYKFE